MFAIYTNFNLFKSAPPTGKGFQVSFKNYQGCHELSIIMLWLCIHILYLMVPLNEKIDKQCTVQIKYRKNHIYVFTETFF